VTQDMVSACSSSLCNNFILQPPWHPSPAGQVQFAQATGAAFLLDDGGGQLASTKEHASPNVDVQDRGDSGVREYEKVT